MYLSSALCFAAKTDNAASTHTRAVRLSCINHTGSITELRIVAGAPDPRTWRVCEQGENSKDDKQQKSQRDLGKAHALKYPSV